ncbi:MAG: PssD/Cps14F family polysaccharide biosynthesis glycosyltransferase [Candidatus Diapherotrites archaeon]
MKICLAGSGGGHLNELMQLKNAFEKYEHYFVTFQRPNSTELAKKENVFFVECPGRNPVKFLRNFIQSVKIFLKEKPDLIISTGADAAVATCIIGKIFGKKIIFIESFARVEELSLSGKIIYPFADLFLVQWDKLAEKYKKAVYGGPIY